MQNMKYFQILIFKGGQLLYYYFIVIFIFYNNDVITLQFFIMVTLKGK